MDLPSAKKSAQAVRDKDDGQVTLDRISLAVRVLQHSQTSLSQFCHACRPMRL